ncbi:MAG: hypothetical protein DRJ52_08955 [Thermoprotei archaeon]|nr:MAG: hypothetical protein DRJ52_08955 [Thermoprotei archaeon]
MIITLAIATILIWLAGGIAYYVLGNYTRANEYFMNSLKTAFAVAIPAITLNIADKIFTAFCREFNIDQVKKSALTNLPNATEYHVYKFESSVVWAWQRLKEVSKNFLNLHQKCVDWIFFEASVKSFLYATIIAAPIANVVDSACTTWRMILTWSSSFLLSIYVVSVIMSQYYDIMLIIGSALIPCDLMRLRQIGATLYAIPVIYGPALYIWSFYAGKALANPDVSNVPSVTSFKFDLSNINPINTVNFITNISSKMANAAYEVYFVAIGSILGFAVVGALCVALARVLGGPGVRLSV